MPIVEPEVLMDGEHSIERCAEVTERVLHAVFAELVAQGVALEGIVLKPNMVVSGGGCAGRPRWTRSPTRRCACCGGPSRPRCRGSRSCPAASRAELATAHLQRAEAACGPHPWQLTFSYARALQDPALAAWSRDGARTDVAREALLGRIRANGLARDGAWSPEVDAAPVA